MSPLWKAVQSCPECDTYVYLSALKVENYEPKLGLFMCA